MTPYKLLPIILFIILITACNKNLVRVDGYLKGRISIGPICPVERIEADSACMPTAETYLAYPVSIFTRDGRNKITQIHPALDGSYSLDLAAGNYMLKLETTPPHVGGSNLPLEISISSLDTTIINISIDTGIR
jgi:hypothetical protein